MISKPDPSLPKGVKYRKRKLLEILGDAMAELRREVGRCPDLAWKDRRELLQLITRRERVEAAKIQDGGGLFATWRD